MIEYIIESTGERVEISCAADLTKIFMKDRHLKLLNLLNDYLVKVRTECLAQLDSDGVGVDEFYSDVDDCIERAKNFVHDWMEEAGMMLCKECAESYHSGGIVFLGQTGNCGHIDNARLKKEKKKDE